jgi:anti-sigma regulatory factor (Ser/Thr protein kinase)
MATLLRVQVRCRPESLREVRDAVDTLADLDQRIFDAVKLVTNELVGNSIGHSGLGEDDYIEITVTRQRHHVRIDIRDAGSGFTMPDCQPRGFGGRGLAMVQAVSTLVGISHDGHTHAWAEIDLAA